MAGGKRKGVFINPFLSSDQTGIARQLQHETKNAGWTIVESNWFSISGNWENCAFALRNRTVAAREISHASLRERLSAPGKLLRKPYAET